MSALDRVQSPVLVGRDEHLEDAERRLAGAASGHGRTLLIAGEAGIGKTRLLGAIIRQARSLGFVVAKGDIAPQDRDVPGAIVADAARTMCELPALAGAGAAILARWRTAADQGGPAGRQLVRDTVDLLRSSADGPVLFAFEDLQWADDLSLDVIAELARTIETRPIAIIAVHRHDDVAADAPLRTWRSRLLTQRHAEEIRLERLTSAQTGTVVGLLMGGDLPAPREVVEAIHERSDGVPLHVEELMAAVRARGPVTAVAIRDVDVPDTIEDAVLARTARLSPQAQAVARAGAVMGRCFVPDVLAGVMDLPVTALDDPLEELVEHSVLYPFGAKDVGYHDFRHQLLREALYRHTPVRERRRLHARAAEFGAQLVGATEVHASIHYAEAGLRDEAYRAALAGAEAAARVHAHREAYELYRRAQRFQPADGEAATRAALSEAVAAEALALEETSVAVHSARAAADAYREAGDVARAIAAEMLVLVAWRRDGHPVSERLELGGRLHAELATLGEPDSELLDELRADLDIYRALALVDAYRFAEARDLIRRVRTSPAWHGSLDLRLAADELEAMMAFVEVGPEVGIARMAAAANEAMANRQETASLSGLRDGAILAARALDHVAARRFIEDGVRLGDELEQSHCAHVMRGVGTVVAWASGSWDEAEQSARHVIADRGCQRGAAHARWALGYVAVGRGDTTAARRELEAALAWAQRSESIELILPALWGLAEAALHGGDPSAAAGRCEAALTRARAVGERALLVPFVVTGVRAYQAAGQPADADRWLAEVAAHIGPSIAFAQPALDHGAGLVALAAGNTGAARRALEAAVAAWDARERIWEASWARLDLCAALARSHRFPAAVALAGQVREAADRLRSPMLLERAEAVARQGRGRIVELEPWYPLTVREYEVARLVTHGRTNAEIAEELHIAPKTASSHVEHILAKLGASRRAEIAVWASAIERSPTAR